MERDKTPIVEKCNTHIAKLPCWKSPFGIFFDYLSSLTLDIYLPWVPPASALIYVDEMGMIEPFRRKNWIGITPGNRSFMRYLTIVDISDEDMRSIPGHQRMLPRNPCEVFSIWGETKMGIELVSAEQSSNLAFVVYGDDFAGRDMFLYFFANAPDLIANFDHFGIPIFTVTFWSKRSRR